MTWKTGDEVVLKSGGPRMTVDRVDGDRVHCAWFCRVMFMEERPHGAIAVSPRFSVLNRDNFASEMLLTAPEKTGARSGAEA